MLLALQLPISVKKECVKFEYIPHCDPIGELVDGGDINVEVMATWNNFSASAFRSVNSGLVDENANARLEAEALDRLNELLSDFIIKLNKVI